MSKARGVVFACGFGLAALALADCAKKADESAVYAADQCRRVALIDKDSGASVRGAEDFAYDSKNNTLYVSAYDRRAAEKAAKKNAAAIPEGGVYKLKVSDLLAAGEGPIAVRSLLPRSDVAGGLRPHGVAYDSNTGEVIFVNRGYRHADGTWKMTARLERVGANGESYIGKPVAVSCAANDVLAEENRVLATDDHDACGWRAGLEDIFARKRGGVSAVGDGAVFTGAGYANGIVKTLGGDILVATTREKALLVLSEKHDALTRERKIALPGGPDNLTLGVDGNVIVAVHPSLMRIGLQRRLGMGRAPSRVVKVDPDRGDVRLLFDDPSGRLFAGATVAAETPKALVLGSVVDDGLLVCERSG